MAESSDEAFLNECRSVARCFIYFSIEEDPETRSPDAAVRKTSEASAKLLAEEDPQAVLAGRRLRELGDQIDAQLKTELEAAFKELWRERSVWEVGMTEFSRLCNSVATSGWNQVWVVYTCMGRLVREVRQQGGAQQQGGAAGGDTESRDALGGTATDESQEMALALRERNLQEFAVNYMRDCGLQTWIEENGGMVCVYTHEGQTDCVHVAHYMIVRSHYLFCRKMLAIADSYIELRVVLLPLDTCRTVYCTYLITYNLYLQQT